MNIQEIKEITPHRCPILSVDRAEEMVGGEQIIAKKDVMINEPSFQGHSPEEPVMSGALIVEVTVQAGVAVLLSPEQSKGKTAYFDGLDKARSRKGVTPGDTLHLEVGILKVKASAGMGEGIAKVGGKKVAGAELTFIIR